MSAPLSLPPNCVLYIDGVRMNDGSLGENPADPVALDDLRVVWGRNNSLDQPEPTTVSFRVLDEVGGQRFLERLHIGSLIDVFAEAVLYPDPSISIMADPGFEGVAVGGSRSATGVNVSAVVTDERAHTGSKASRVEPFDGSRRAVIIWPPADWGGVSAWDGVPRSLPGQSWQFGASVWAGQWLSAVQGVKVRPVAFTNPSGAPGSYTVLSDELIANSVGGNWQVLSGRFVPPAGVWLGLAVELYPTGPAWQDVPAEVLWNSLGAVPVWQDLACVWIDDLQMLAPAAGALRAGNVVSARVTDMEARYEIGLGATVVEVTGQSHLAELGNRYVGAAPWPMEALSTRFGKVVAESGQAVQWTVDSGVAGVPVSWRDVDNQPAATLLGELAKSVGGALWSAASVVSGPYLWLEDIDSRPALFALEMGGDGLVHIVIAPVVGEKGIELSACDVLLDPVRWVQSTEDNSTRVALTWREQTIDDQGKQDPTDRIETAFDPVLEAATGQRRIGVSTQLAELADARRVANSLLGRVATPSWRVSGLTIRMDLTEKLDAKTLATVMTILDASTRLGVGIVVTDLPEFSPAGVERNAVYLEGGRFTNESGMWTLELLTSSAAAQGKPDVAWSEVPSDWSWDEFDPAIAWADLAGVGME